MTDHERVLPADLAEIERLLREPAPAPPPALLSRIEASRELGVVVERMMLAEEEFSARTRRKRTIIGIAAAAVLLVGAFGALSRLETRTGRPATPLTAARVPQVAAAAGLTPSTASEVSRLLQPWPSVAHAQGATRGPLVRAPGAPLEFGARARVYPSSREYTQLRRDANGRTVGRSRVAVQLDSMTYRGALRWLLTTRIDEGDRTAQADTLMLDMKTLNPIQRRVVAHNRHWYYRFTPTRVEATDTLPGVFFEDEFEFERRTRFWAPDSSRRGWWYAIKKVDPTSRLVLSEAHLALLLRTLPLDVGLEMPIAFVNSSQQLFGASAELQLRVTKVDTLAHEGVATPCVRVELDYGARPDLWWVRVSDGELIRASRLTPGPVVSEVTWLTAVNRSRR